MTESKIVYVNEDDGSDNEDENLIYGAAPKPQETAQPPIEQIISPPASVKPEEAEQEPEAKELKAELEEAEQEPEQEPEAKELKAELEEAEQEPEQEPEAKELKADLEESEQEAEQEAEYKNEVDEKSDGGSMFGGGDGYRSEPDDASSVSSLDTDAILNVDPLYFRLTKFLQTGGSEPENVAEILKKINTNLEHMNQNLMNLMNVKSSQ